MFQLSGFHYNKNPGSQRFLLQRLAPEQLVDLLLPHVRAKIQEAKSGFWGILYYPHNGVWGYVILIRIVMAVMGLYRGLNN